MEAAGRMSPLFPTLERVGPPFVKIHVNVAFQIQYPKESNPGVAARQRKWFQIARQYA